MKSSDEKICAIKKLEPEKRCPFCDVLSGRTQEHIIATSQFCIAVPDIRPITPGHTLIIPKVHQSEFCLLTNEVVQDMFSLARSIEGALRRCSLQYKASSIFMECGRATRQEFPHVHLHVIPRFDGDGFGLLFPEGYWDRKPSQEELGAVADSIRQGLEKDPA